MKWPPNILLGLNKSNYFTNKLRHSIYNYIYYVTFYFPLTLLSIIFFIFTTTQLSHLVHYADVNVDIYAYLYLVSIHIYSARN